MRTSLGATLRKHCLRFDSIAQVCEGAGINRQQFNKYLADQVVPSARTLRKICDFLGVSEEELLTGSKHTASGWDVSAGPSPSVDLLALLGTQRLGDMTFGALTAGIGALRQGYYYCFFPLQNTTTYLMRSLVRMRERSGTMYFTRRTAFPTGVGSRRHLARGSHNGLVLTGSAEIYLVGVNSKAPHQLSFITFSKDWAFGQDIMSGLSITRTGTNQFASVVCMQYLGAKLPAKKLLGHVGPIHIQDTSLDARVQAIMTAAIVTGSNQMIAPDLDMLLPEEAALRSHASSDIERQELKQAVSSLRMAR